MLPYYTFKCNEMLSYEIEITFLKIVLNINGGIAKIRIDKWLQWPS